METITFKARVRGRTNSNVKEITLNYNEMNKENFNIEAGDYINVTITKEKKQ